MQSNYNPEKKLSKKTTVIRRIERRTPNGKLISTTKSKSVYIGDNFNLLSLENESDDHHTSPEQKKIDKAIQSDESYFYKQNGNEPKSIHQRSTPIEWVTQKKTDDDLSTRSNDTYLKDSQLIQQYPKKILLPNLQILSERINRYRRSNKVFELQADNYLMHIAKEYASQMVLNHRNRTRDVRLLNIWSGRIISEDIVDEWNHEMSTYWGQNYFEQADLTRIGIGFAKDHLLQLYIVIAVYE